MKRRRSRHWRDSVAAALVAAALVIVPSCAANQHGGDVVDARGAADQNKGVVRDFFRVFSTGNVSDILALMRDDVTYWVSGSVPPFSGVKTKPQLAEVFAGLGDVFVGGKLPLTPTSLFQEGELVFAEATGRAELKNGRIYEPRAAWVFRIEQGLIVEIKEYIDTKHSYEVFLAP